MKVDDSPAAILQGLIDADLTDLAAVEALRLRHCPVCQWSKALPEAARIHACDKERCHLRQICRLKAEVSQVSSARQWLLDPNDTSVSKDVVKLLNRHISKAGVATLQLAWTATGSLTMATSRRTLRAAIHSALVVYLAREGGDVLWNASTGTTKQGQDAISDAREYYGRQQRQALLDRVVAVYRRLGSINAASGELEMDRKKVRELLREAGEI